MVQGATLTTGALYLEDLNTSMVIRTSYPLAEAPALRGHGFGLTASIVCEHCWRRQAGWILPHSGVVLVPGVRPSIVNGVVGHESSCL